MQQLLFVYNAKSGFINSALDLGHKLLSPNTYSCNLCAITHTTFSENKAWTNFRDQSKMDMEFYHLDEFEKEFFGQEFNYPAVLLRNGDDLKEYVSSAELNAMKDVEELISKLIHNFQ